MQLTISKAVDKFPSPSREFLIARGLAPEIEIVVEAVAAVRRAEPNVGLMSDWLEMESWQLRSPEIDDPKRKSDIEHVLAPWVDHEVAMSDARTESE